MTVAPVAVLGFAPLIGPAGEPVDFWRTATSHGLGWLPPFAPDDAHRSLTVVLPLPGGAPRAVRLSAEGGAVTVSAAGPPPSPGTAAALLTGVRHVLRLDADLSGFYDLLADDPELSWAVQGAGRLLRAPSVFCDVVRTICTTNCAWSATTRMVRALVDTLGEPTADGAMRAFPTPAAMAAAGEAFFATEIRAGYRARALHQLAVAVAEGALDLESLTDPALDDHHVEATLLALRGVGPYAAAHLLMLLGRYGSLTLDSWTRPTFLRISGMRQATDRTIQRRFSRYGQWAGLAFWLYLTRGWVPQEQAAPLARAPLAPSQFPPAPFPPAQFTPAQFTPGDVP